MTAAAPPASPVPAEPTVVTAANVGALGRGLPLIFGAALRLPLACRQGTLDLGLPDGRWLRYPGAEEGPHAVMAIHDWKAARRIVVSGDVGVAEGYMAGEWSSPDVTRFLEYFCVNTDALHALFAGRPYMRLVQWVRQVLNRNSRRQAERNIHAHYDLGNRFYGSWLDSTMTYSSAIFAEGDNDLASAQMRKNRELAASIGLKPEHHVLEIGCGWGGFAEFAAREIGCRVTGLTISREQYDYAVERIRRAGLEDRVTIKYQDYRDETARYDRIASIEMFEAVGESYWPGYFRMLESTLAPQGRAGLQVITIQDRFFPFYRRDIDFIRRYIFPGGMLPTATILQGLGQRFGLSMVGERIFGHDYARTLAAWRDRFAAAWPAIEPLGFDERFRRLWEYYLHYCEAGFRSGNIDVRQMVFAKA